MNIEKLNNKYFTLFSSLYSERAKLPGKQYDLMADALHRLYEDELMRLFDQIELETSAEEFMLKLKIANETPKRGFFWRWNKYAKKLRENYFADFENTLAQIGKNTALMKADTQERLAETTPISTEQATVTALPNAEATVLLEQKPKG